MDTDNFKADLLVVLPRLRAYAIGLTGSKAAGDDLLQETLLRAWRFKDGFRYGTNMSAWIHAIMRNTHRSTATSQRRFVQDVDGLYAANAACEAEQEWSIRYSEMLKALQKLSLKTREALLLVVGEGLSYAEAGEAVGCPAGTIKSRVNRARQQLAELTSIDVDALDRIEVRSAAGGVRSHEIARRSRVAIGGAHLECYA